MTRFKRARDYAKPKPANPLDPKWAGRYLTQNFEFSRLAAITGVNVERCIHNVEVTMMQREFPANKAFLVLLDDAIGELQRMKYRVLHDPDLTDYDESHYCASGSDAGCYWEESTGKWTHKCAIKATEAQMNGTQPWAKTKHVQPERGQSFEMVRQPVFPDGCLMRRPLTPDTALCASPTCALLSDGRIKHHPDCPIEPTEADAEVCSECENEATTYCKRCDSGVCEDCFVHYHFSGKRHEIG